ncbi:hypothetical protein BBK36DRAFT_1199334 [Trichoderma citrinoviride]|uniref:Uncharacterized protein n=1 Tax=Trichoderma citrinoviride TaxID=58853 RepID=A0A2T4BCK9_9HYPO|nr:hypothetical protein BBK36DRAFT_1199334 [Trichoderma citrinoviride]PTB67045.1 hypothetical protein BBK36DRAFT_1199334 [Trichoderma citrinoviride]
MPPLQSLMAPRTRGSRKAARGPKTPEPFATTDTQPPSPPRPRFRLRRRAPLSNLKAPTQQFLASVATADVPIPSIEEPRLVDEDMAVDTLTTTFPRFSPYHLAIPGDSALPRGRAYSPPKTPAPRAVPSLSPKRFPNWSLDQAYSSLESSPECDSRPSTAQSTQTASSLFSRYSLNSDNLSQYSIDTDDLDQLGSSSIEDGNKTITLRVPGAAAAAAAAAAGASSRRSRRAPWTRSMSQHLWSVYMTYLQDPHVTPFHIGKSGIPPHGVCTRVAREAKRSWKGSKPQQAKAAADHSGSATPTVGAAPTSYVQWPHSCAATRAHLRELCKARATTAARSQRYAGRNPPPFGRASNRYWNRRLAPSRSSSAFSGNDMALSLAVSTCESMQPNGPLAQLTGSQDEPSVDIELCSPPPLVAAAAPAPGSGAAGADLTRLGSPFVARSYGPSASSSLADSFGMDLEPQGPISSSVGTRRRSLGSPARLSNNSRGSTQKRRSKQQPAAVEPRRKRPSLGSDFWVDPSNNGGASTQAAPSAEFSSTTSTQRDALFIPRTNLQELFEASQPRAPLGPGLAPGLAPALAAAPARLGSPFSAAKASFSFPGRRSASISAIDFSIIRRPFATVQQPVESESSPPKSSLRSRLAYIDERLKDFRRRDRRSQSPV